MSNKFLFIIFILINRSYHAQQLDTAIVIKDYFSHHDAKKRSAYHYPKTDSMVKPPPTTIYKFAEYVEQEPKRKVFVINDTEVSMQVYMKESEKFDKKKYKPYYLIVYHKNGNLFYKGKFLEDESMDTCIIYTDSGKLHYKTYNDLELTKDYDPSLGKPLRIKHFSKTETYNEKGILISVFSLDYDKNLKTTETYDHNNGKLLRSKTEKTK